MKRLIIPASLLMASLSASAVSPLWMRDVKISPDGKTIAFSYKGDIFTVPSTGGNATRLTTSAAYESTPIWSPDGTKIASASDRQGYLHYPFKGWTVHPSYVQLRGRDSGSLLPRRQERDFLRLHTETGCQHLRSTQIAE